MRKLTKMQHRRIISGLVTRNGKVQDLRCIQQVAELFQKEAECDKGESLVACEGVRLLLDLVNGGQAHGAYSALYGVLESEDNAIDDVLDTLEVLDGRQISLVLSFARALAGMRGGCRA
ncbi:MAG: hypothetical protein OSJ71_17510 [Acetatifactor sp.]|nr:hypothetical protein [Acetatifactor sp.]